MSPGRFGVTWWRWSALVALAVSGIEAICLVVAALQFGQAEFAGVAAPFVAFALVAALAADPLLILVWLVLARDVGALRGHRGWLVLFVLILCIPLLMAPRSWYEAAVAAPALLGFLLPRFIIRRLTTIPEHAE